MLIVAQYCNTSLDIENPYVSTWAPARAHGHALREATSHWIPSDIRYFDNLSRDRTPLLSPKTLEESIYS